MNSYATGSVVGDIGGGLIGLHLGSMENCYAAGTVGDANIFVGGLVGENEDGLGIFFGQGDCYKFLLG